MAFLGLDEKWKNSVLAGIIFLLLNLPATYKLTDSILGNVSHTSNAEGCPSNAGLLIHTIVFIVIVRLLMDRN